jgi:catalase
MAKKEKTFTTNFGMPIANDQNTITAGNPGPALMQNVHLLEKLADFDRERILERVVHAEVAGVMFLPTFVT